MKNAKVLQHQGVWNNCKGYFFLDGGFCANALAAAVLADLLDELLRRTLPAALAARVEVTLLAFDFDIIPTPFLSICI
jgi:hypothetical protein